MTRINVVPVEELSNKHLMAEYRELPRIFTRVKKGNIDLGSIPESYRMGTGHVTFFYDKCKWLAYRYMELVHELYNRGYNLNKRQWLKIIESAQEELVDTPYWNWYDPTPEALSINRARIKERS